MSLRVAMISRRVHPAHGPGGLERHVFELATRLVRSGVAVDLFAETPNDARRRHLAEHSFADGVSVHWVSARRLPIGRRKGTVVLDRITNYPWWARRVAKVLRRLQRRSGIEWTAVHVHGLAGWGVARAMTRMSPQVPLIVTNQGLEEFQSHVRLKRWAYAPFRAGMRTVARRSDAVVTTDSSLVPVVERCLRVPADKQIVIPNAVDPEGCRQLGNRRRGCELLEGLGFNDASPVFLSVGRIEANKGFALLASALADAAPSLPPSWAWVLVGDGPEREQVKQTIVELGLESRAVLVGRLDDGDLHSLYAVSDWFVHPTLYEGSSLVTLEAMAHGLPVVASRTGGLPDKVLEGETGFLVAPGDRSVLSGALVEAGRADGPALGARGRRLCEERFSWDAVVPQYVALYQRVCDA